MSERGVDGEREKGVLEIGTIIIHPTKPTAESSTACKPVQLKNKTLFKERDHLWKPDTL
jgi:hypothetical protein